MRTYLIVYDSNFDVIEIVKYFDTIKDKINGWQVSIPNSIFVKSELNSYAIFELLIKQFPPTQEKDMLFFVCAIGGDTSGLLPENHWPWLGRNQIMFPTK